MSQWRHRIDEVPEIGRRIDKFGLVHIAEVKPLQSGDEYFGGVGDDVRLRNLSGALSGMYIIPSLAWCSGAMFDVEIKRDWFGFGKAHYYVVHRNSKGRSIVDEAFSEEAAEEIAAILNSRPDHTT